MHEKTVLILHASLSSKWTATFNHNARRMHPFISISKSIYYKHSLLLIPASNCYQSTSLHHLITDTVTVRHRPRHVIAFTERLNKLLYSSKIWYAVPFCYSITLRVPVKQIYGLALLTVVCINLVCLQLRPLHTSATLK